MLSSARQAIACILLIWPTIIFAQSQTAPDKSDLATISGRVTHKDNGVSGVTVGLILLDEHRQSSSRQKAITDEDGNYRITNVAPGSYDVAVSLPAYVAASGSRGLRKPIVIVKGETVENVDFAIARGGVITGKVTDSDGRPLIEMEVNVTPTRIEVGAAMRSGIRTDDRGIYRAFGLTPGKYMVSAGMDERSSIGSPWMRAEYKLTYHPAGADPSQATIVEVTEGGEATNVDITLNRGSVRYSASGRIVDGETGQPIAGAHYGVQVLDQNYEGSHSGGMVTSDQGVFRLQNLAPGNYAILVEPPSNSDWRVESGRFKIVDQDISGLVFKTSKGASISGVVVLDEAEGKPLPNMARYQMHAYISGARGRGANRNASINADGSFRISGLPSGVVNFWLVNADRLQVVEVERQGIASGRGIEVKELEQITGVRVVVNYANGIVRGTVKLPNGSLSPNQRIHVNLRRVGDELNMWAVNSTPAVDGRGQFVTERLVPGTYEVRAYLLPSDMSSYPNTKIPETSQQVVVTNGNASTVTLTFPQN